MADSVPHNAPLGFNPDALKNIWAKDPVLRIATLARFIKEAEPHRSMAQESVFKQQCYRRNRYRIDARWVENQLELREEQDAKELNRPYHSINFTLGLALLRVARYLALVPEWVARFDTGKESDRYVAEVVATFLKRLIDPEREREKPMLIDQMTFGVQSIFKVAWDKNAGVELLAPRRTHHQTPFELGEEPLVNIKVGKRRYPIGTRQVYHAVDKRGTKLYDTRMTGAPVFRALGPTEFNLDPLAGARGIHAARWAFDQRRVSAEELYELYPDKWDELRKFVWSEKLASGETDRRMRDVAHHPTTSKYSQTALLTDFYYRPAPNFGVENGLHSVFILGEQKEVKPGNTNNVELEGPERLRTPRRSLPYIGGAVEVFDGTDFWGFSMFKVSSEGQKQANLFWTLATEAAEAGVVTTMAASDMNQSEAGVKTEPEENLPRGVRLIKVGGNLRDVKQIGGGQAVPVNLAMLRQTIELVESTTATRGLRAEQEELAAQVKRALEQDKTVFGVVLRRLVDVYTEASIYALEWIQLCASPDDMKKVAVEHDAIEVDAFFDKPLRPFLKLEVKGAALIDDPAIILMLMRTLPQMPGWEKIYAPQTLADMLSLGRRFGQTQRDYHVERAERENSRLRKKAVPVDLRDDDDVHDYVHGLYYIANYDFMNDDERSRRRTHMDKHKENRIAKLEDEAKQAVLAKMTVQKVLDEFGPPKPPAGAGPTSETSSATPAQRVQRSSAAPPPDEGAQP